MTLQNQAMKRHAEALTMHVFSMYRMYLQCFIFMQYDADELFKLKWFVFHRLSFVRNQQCAV